ncbi:MAG: type III secretion system export apparatus subunit SctU [Candidatus Anaerobiospirillum merdipullorum]|uniref:Type III secretion system export apparatus subunit SctU n=1 Tax=Candidatus Anaerobiospirillum merdipullorum TaxID=2838450 RepID=A0A9E2NRP9_9GAMM|nr:type III secretion system export apparatus subunit SctU [Candidatus Anaerobiospirillum merdipullorum]
MSGEKTEQPSDKRLRDAREQGDIPKSTEVVSAATVFAVAGLLIASADDFFANLSDVISYVLENSARMPYDEALELISALVIECSLDIVMPIVAAVIIAALVSLLAQTGFLIAPKAAMPKLDNLNPAKWFKQVFSKKNLFEFFKNILKVVVLTVAVYMAVLDHSSEIFKIPTSSVGAMWRVAGSLFYDMIIYALVAFGVLAAIDFVYTRFKYTKDHMMSMEEVKQEFKESEGDPHIKQKRKQLHQEMSNQATVAKTRKAKVLIVNPTHYAVAIDYEPGKTKLPVIVAKGQGEMARRMIKAAQEEKIPVMRQPALARALFADGVEDAFVPSDLLIQVAEVLKVVAKLKENSDGR